MRLDRSHHHCQSEQRATEDARDVKNVRLWSSFVLDVVPYVMRYSKPLLDEESNKSFFRDRHPVR